NGIEKASNILMPVLFVLIIVMSIRSITMPGAKAGLEFLFKPDFSKITSKVILSAMGQAFFSLSVGMGCLITYSSYFSRKTDLVRTSLIVGGLDTIIALLAGVIIFPAVFSFGIAPSAGPQLVFITLPNVFSQMAGGYFFSIAFFVLLVIAALTSTISLSEVITAYIHEEFNVSRRKATMYIFFIVIVLSILCSLSLSNTNSFGLFGKNLFDLFDFTASNILLPLGGMLISIFVGWYVEKNTLRDELTNQGTVAFRLFSIYVFLLRYFAPIAIGLIFLNELGLLKLFS
ncbi:MAG: sodium-dependent transporter, partial [Bacteroidales bacterium]